MTNYILQKTDDVLCSKLGKWKHRIDTKYKWHFIVFLTINQQVLCSCARTFFIYNIDSEILFIDLSQTSRLQIGKWETGVLTSSALIRKFYFSTGNCVIPKGLKLMILIVDSAALFELNLLEFGISVRISI